MPRAMEMVRNCGWMGFLILLIAVVAIVIGIAALAVAALSRRARVAVAVVALLIAFAVPATGVIGTVMGRSATNSALVGVEPALQGRIRQAGYSEAAQCTALGAFGGFLPGLMSMGALLIAIVRRASKDRPNED